MNTNIKTDSGIDELLNKAEKTKQREELYPQESHEIERRYRQALRIHRPKNK